MSVEEVDPTEVTTSDNKLSSKLNPLYSEPQANHVKTGSKGWTGRHIRRLVDVDKAGEKDIRGHVQEPITGKYTKPRANCRDLQELEL